MNPLSLSSRLAFFALALLPVSALAEEIPFPEQGNPAEHFFLTKSPAQLRFEGEGRMAYQLSEGNQHGGTLLAVLTQGGSDVYSTAEKVSIDIRLSSHNSFGIYLKAAERTGSAYLFLLQARPEHRGAIRLCRLPLLPLSGRIEDHELKAVAFKSYDSSAWHKLELTVKESGDAVLLEALLLDEQGREVAHLVTRDAGDVLRGAGLVGLRFYAPTAQSNGGFEEEPYLFEVRRLNVEPAPAH